MHRSRFLVHVDFYSSYKCSQDPLGCWSGAALPRDWVRQKHWFRLCLRVASVVFESGHCWNSDPTVEITMEINACEVGEFTLTLLSVGNEGSFIPQINI